MTLQFVNSDLKQTVDRIMNELFSGGVNNPMTAIEQISYFMFLKSLTEYDTTQERIAKLANKTYASVFNGKRHKYGWDVICRLSGDELAIIRASFIAFSASARTSCTFCLVSVRTC